MYLPDRHSTREKGMRGSLKRIKHSIKEKMVIQNSKTCYLIFSPTIIYSLFVKITLVYWLREVVSISRTIKLLSVYKKSMCLLFLITHGYHLPMIFALFQRKGSFYTIKAICTYEFTT